jgi:hypothetical protein
MFKFTAYGRRVGRIAFGLVLLAGVAVLARRVWAYEEAWSAYAIPATWAAAFAAYAIAGLIGSRRTLDHAGELAVPGLVVPWAGAALLLPLTLHLPFALLLTHDARAFDMWVAMSGIFTGPTHLVLAALVAQRARQLATGARAIDPWRIYGICVAVSCLPFAIFMIPPILVMLTGIPMLAFLIWMKAFARRDRDRARAEALPRATARLPQAA